MGIGFHSVILGLISILLTVYMSLYRPHAEIAFEVINAANVLDIHKPLKDLTISFRGENIQEKQLNLRILTVRVENTGRVDILESLYDHRQPWGFSVINGDIIEVRAVGSSDPYLLKCARTVQLKDGSVEFPKCIIDRGKYFVLELLVVHRKDRSPSIEPIGKIAGIDSFPVTNRALDQQKRGFLAESVSGGLGVNIFRFVVSILAMIVLVVSGVYISEGFEALRKTSTERKRKARIKTLENEGVLHPNDSQHRYVEELYVHEGLEGLKALDEFLSRPDLSETAKHAIEFNQKQKERMRAANVSRRDSLSLADLARFQIGPEDVEHMVGAEILHVQEDGIIEDPFFHEEFNAAVSRLKEMHPQ